MLIVEAAASQRATATCSPWFMQCYFNQSTELRVVLPRNSRELQFLQPTVAAISPTGSNPHFLLANAAGLGKPQMTNI